MIQKLFLACSILFISGSCSNFTSEQFNTVPPLLISITANSDINGYSVTVRANNPETFFVGYRLYIGNSDSEARNPADLNTGTDCLGGLAIIPNQPIEYTLDIDPDAAGSRGGVACTFATTVSSGQYISVRGLLLSIQPSQTNNTVSISLPSNSLIIP
ncbi:MAG: hypothetical protein AAF518_00995 [Spirochaetota bacterium]